MSSTDPQWVVLIQALLSPPQSSLLTSKPLLLYPPGPQGWGVDTDQPSGISQWWGRSAVSAVMPTVVDLEKISLTPSPLSYSEVGTAEERMALYKKSITVRNVQERQLRSHPSILPYSPFSQFFLEWILYFWGVLLPRTFLVCVPSPTTECCFCQIATR